mmetsp:Transcript_9700/g.17876  ORF Transcript_9700/g.17876 Transcript_9700/m.17876 type:complete len:201 (-) Transcript_9700:547-1149(-)
MARPSMDFKRWTAGGMGLPPSRIAPACFLETTWPPWTPSQNSQHPHISRANPYRPQPPPPCHPLPLLRRMTQPRRHHRLTTKAATGQPRKQTPCSPTHRRRHSHSHQASPPPPPSRLLLKAGLSAKRRALRSGTSKGHIRRRFPYGGTTWPSTARLLASGAACLRCCGRTELGGRAKSPSPPAARATTATSSSSLTPASW